MKENEKRTLHDAAASTLATSNRSCPQSAADAVRKDPPVRIGVVGTGQRGTALLKILLELPDVEIKALCDIDKTSIQTAIEAVTASGRYKPDVFCDDELAYQQLMDRDDIDAVIIATSWLWHAPMAVYAMKAGKYAAIEVPAALTLKECWDLVIASETTGIPCMMLENWSFRRDNLAVLNMIRQGLFGEIVHCHCAHSHDCIDHWFFDDSTGDDRWPAEYLLKYNRDQYPTHSLGPVLSWMDIGSGDYFDTVTSVATASFGIQDMFIRKFGRNHPGAKRQYAQGDIVTTLVHTKKRKTIVINYDMQLPRPYDNRWMIQGTRGVYNESNNSVYIVDNSPEYHEWEPFEPYQGNYDHFWWKNQHTGGHGGTDRLELMLFIGAVREKRQTPLDIYDSVLMSCIVPLSGLSIKAGSKPVKVPDFTRGRWQTAKPTFAQEN
jgi:predicted dehydrogenase